MRGATALCWALLALNLPATEALQPGHRLRAEIDHALVSLADEGASEPLTAARRDWFTAPVGRSEADGTIRHWTEHLRLALARLDPETRMRTRTVLEALYRGGPRDLRLASAMLPAPSAAADLTAAADRAFDRGDMLRFLHAAALLDRHVAGWDRAPARRSVAAAWLGRASDPVVDHGRVALGPVVPIDAHGPLLPDDQGRDVRWVQREGLLLALDPWGRIRWQRGIDRRASRVVTGPGAAVIEAPHALVVIDESGRSREWPRPLDTEARAVGDGGSWYALGERVFRMDLATGSVRRWTLPAATIGEPVVGDGIALWLTADHLVATAADGSVRSYAHDLDLGHATLRRDRHGVVLISDRGLWRVAPGPGADAPLAQRLEDLVRADRFAAAIAAYRAQVGSPSPTAQAWYARARIGHGLDVAEALELAAAVTEPLLRSRILLAAAHPLAGDEPGDPTILAALAELARDHPDLTVPGTPPADPLAPRHAWPHRITLAGLVAAANRPPFAAEAYAGAVREPGAAPAAPLTAAAEVEHRLGPWRFAAWRQGGAIVIAAQCAGVEVWRHRLAGGGFHLPGIELAVAGDRLLLEEGGSRVHVLDPLSGRHQASHQLADLVPLQRLAATADAIAVLVPIHRPAAIEIRRDGRRQRIETASPPRWVISLDERFLSAHADGSVRILGTGDRLEWPAELAAGLRPGILPAGLWVGRERWRPVTPAP